MNCPHPPSAVCRSVGSSLAAIFKKPSTSDEHRLDADRVRAGRSAPSSSSSSSSSSSPRRPPPHLRPLLLPPADVGAVPCAAPATPSSSRPQTPLSPEAFAYATADAYAGNAYRRVPSRTDLSTSAVRPLPSVAPRGRTRSTSDPFGHRYGLSLDSPRRRIPRALGDNERPGRRADVGLAVDDVPSSCRERPTAAPDLVLDAFSSSMLADSLGNRAPDEPSPSLPPRRRTSSPPAAPASFTITPAICSERQARRRRIWNLSTSARSSSLSKRPSTSCSVDLSQWSPSASIAEPYPFPRYPTCRLSVSFSAPGAASAAASDDTPPPPPPAFFPGQRVDALVTLNVLSRSVEHGGVRTLGGLLLDDIKGLQMGLRGEVTAPGSEGPFKRTLVDVTVDLGEGLEIWRRDAKAHWANRRLAKGRAEDKIVREAEEGKRLTPGTYVLPLSVQIPTQPKLPPSCSKAENGQIEIAYWMELGLFGAEHAPIVTANVPFTLLPVTLPTPEPHLPPLHHRSDVAPERLRLDASASDDTTGLFTALIRGLTATPRLYTTKTGGLVSLTQDGTAEPAVTSPMPPTTKRAYHHITPRLPTTTFSPHQTVPISLRIIDRPVKPTDLYIRFAILARTFVRSCPAAAHLDDRAVFEASDEEGCIAEREIVSRWGWIEYAGRGDVDPMKKAQVLVKDLCLPLGRSGVAGQEWTAGYSSSIILPPASATSRGARDRGTPNAERHLHVSQRFYVCVDVGIADGPLAPHVQRVHDLYPHMPRTQPNWFSPAAFPSRQMALTAPWAGPPPKTLVDAGVARDRYVCTAGEGARFPGKLRSLLVPITIGSVSEPREARYLRTWSEVYTSSATAESGPRMVSGTVEDDSQGWLVPPPAYTDAVVSVPAYVF